jgi:hypothetical protein
MAGQANDKIFTLLNMNNQGACGLCHFAEVICSASPHSAHSTGQECQMKSKIQMSQKEVNGEQ